MVVRSRMSSSRGSRSWWRSGWRQRSRRIYKKRPCPFRDGMMTSLWPPCYNDSSVLCTTCGMFYWIREWTGGGRRRLYGTVCSFLFLLLPFYCTLVRLSPEKSCSDRGKRKLATLLSVSIFKTYILLYSQEPRWPLPWSNTRAHCVSARELT